MADHMVALAAGLSAVIVFILLIGLTAYFLCKKRQDQRQDRLISTNPAIPLYTSVLQTPKSSNYGLAEVPFFLPPSLKSSFHSVVPEEREEEEQWERHPHLHSQRGSLAIGSWFPLGSLRPDLYKLPEEPSEWVQPSGSTVRLCFAVQYQQEQEQLLVSLLQAANLSAQFQSNATLVKLQLMPYEDRHHRQAKARCKGCQPQFNDTFVFQVSNNSVDRFTLHMSLYTVDRLKKHHLVGHVLFPLTHSKLQKAAGKVLWRDLEIESDLALSKQGNIQVSLNYSQSLQRITVVVLRARGLQCPSNADVSVQVSLQIHTQVVKTKWTAVTRGSNPTFNEKLTFRLLPTQIDAACLSLEVQQVAPEPPAEGPSSRIRTSISLGLLVIGPFMYARGSELEHWNEMISKSQELVKQWHGLGVANNMHRPT